MFPVYNLFTRYVKLHTTIILFAHFFFVVNMKQKKKQYMYYKPMGNLTSK